MMRQQEVWKQTVVDGYCAERDWDYKLHTQGEKGHQPFDPHWKLKGMRTIE